MGVPELQTELWPPDKDLLVFYYKAGYSINKVSRLHGVNDNTFRRFLNKYYPEMMQEFLINGKESQRNLNKQNNIRTYRREVTDVKNT